MATPHGSAENPIQKLDEFCKAQKDFHENYLKAIGRGRM
jgi:hypothetical protein